MSRSGGQRIATAAALALALLSGCAAPRPNPGADVRGGAASAIESPLLWRAEAPADAGRDVFHLLGSVHLRAPDRGDLGPAVAEAYARCDELVVEVDLSTLSPADVAAENAKHARLPEGRRLREVIAPETYALLEERLAARGTPMLLVERLQPWAAATLLAMLEFRAAGLEAENGVDRLFIDRAAGERPIRGLETLSSQLAMMSGLSPEIQELMLRDALGRNGDLKDEALALVDAWERGDESALSDLLFGTLDAHPELRDFYEAVIFARNEVMADQLVALAGNGRRRLVVLGVGHLVGPRGIPELLAARGFRVERVPRR